MQPYLFIPVALIPGATISLWDPTHSEWQNVTAATGSYTFSSSGASQQHMLANSQRESE